MADEPRAESVPAEDRIGAIGGRKESRGPSADRLHGVLVVSTDQNLITYSYLPIYNLQTRFGAILCNLQTPKET